MTTTNSAYVEFLRANNKLLRQNNDKIREEMLDKIDRLEFELRSTLTELLDIKHSLGYFDHQEEQSKRLLSSRDDLTESAF